MVKKNSSSIGSLALLAALVASSIAPFPGITNPAAAQESSPAPSSAINGTPTGSNLPPASFSPSALEGLIPILLLIMLGGGLWLLRRRQTTPADAALSRDRQPEPGEASPPPEEVSAIPPVVPPAPAIDLPPVLPTQTNPPVVDLPPAEPTPAEADGVIGIVGTTLSPLLDDETQSDVEASKYDVGQTNDAVNIADQSANALAGVDDALPELPSGYGESRIMLMARDPQWAYAYWDIANEQKEALRRQGGTRLALRFYDVTGLDIAVQKPHTVQQYDCEEIAQEWYFPVPISDRDYLVEIGYLAEDGRWLLLARSAPVRIPPIYPTDWSNEQFLTVNWEDDLTGQSRVEIEPPKPSPNLHDAMYTLSLNSEAQRVSGSLYGSMQAVSSYGLGSGVGMMSGIGMSGIGMSGVGMSGVGMFGLGMSGIGMSGIGMSGIGMSGVGMSGVGMSGIGISGAGFSASMPPIRPRKFWLIANAELIVYGATEPDATLTIGGQLIKLNPDGTFRLHLAFPDGNLDFPIVAVAADGIQTRSIRMTFNRETPEQNTNRKDEATDEWFT